MIDRTEAVTAGLIDEEKRFQLEGKDLQPRFFRELSDVDDWVRFSKTLSVRSSGIAPEPSRFDKFKDTNWTAQEKWIRLKLEDLGFEWVRKETGKGIRDFNQNFNIGFNNPNKRNGLVWFASLRDMEQRLIEDYGSQLLPIE